MVSLSYPRLSVVDRKDQQLSWPYTLNVAVSNNKLRFYKVPALLSLKPDPLTEWDLCCFHSLKCKPIPQLVLTTVANEVVKTTFNLFDRYFSLGENTSLNAELFIQTLLLDTILLMCFVVWLTNAINIQCLF